MAGSSQEEETCCHKHISLCLNPDDTEVPITQPGAWCVSSAGWVDMGVTHVHENFQLYVTYFFFNLYTGNIWNEIQYKLNSSKADRQCLDDSNPHPIESMKRGNQV